MFFKAFGRIVQIIKKNLLEDLLVSTPFKVLNFEYFINLYNCVCTYTFLFVIAFNISFR